MPVTMAKRVPEEVVALVKRLAEDGRNTVVVLSGKGEKDLEDLRVIERLGVVWVASLRLSGQR